MALRVRAARNKTVFCAGRGRAAVWTSFFFTFSPGCWSFSSLTILPIPTSARHRAGPRVVTRVRGSEKAHTLCETGFGRHDTDSVLQKKSGVSCPHAVQTLRHAKQRNLTDAAEVCVQLGVASVRGGAVHPDLLFVVRAGQRGAK